MSAFFFEPAANHALDEIYQYIPLRIWVKTRQTPMSVGLLGFFDDVASRRATWRAVPAEFGVAGYFGKYEHHFVYWRMLRSGDIGIAATLHERMHQMDRIRALFP